MLRIKNLRIVLSKNKLIENGCTESLYGVKSKCILNIVPKNSNKNTFNIDKKCNITKK